MNAAPKGASLPLSARLLRSYLRSNLRGRTRLTFFLARNLKSLHAVPVVIADQSPVYVDMRLGHSHELLKNSPYEIAPWEVGEQKVMRRVVARGDVAFDVGANIGLHTTMLSQLVGAGGKVYAFEPNAGLLPTLGLTVEALDNSTLYPFALSDQALESVLFVPEDQSMASLADWTGGRVGKRLELPCQQHRLDDLIEAGMVAPPTFIKCDVEGAELSVFRGGIKALDRPDAPIILFEANVHTARAFGLTVSSTMDFLANLEPPRFKFFEVGAEGELTPIVTANPVHSNILAVPASKMHRLPEI